ncbi:hypothetical protein DPMN_130902 [Dreissena polymorpha]|uniref:Uncharacterized protein n=1 Tax=Dreissena polymorpha TaxID=45954 RepID=A0A9D4HBV3_DREPO|nr:hypothetical protein DPMN_130902 [Dreissena polymorpha]
MDLIQLYCCPSNLCAEVPSNLCAEVPSNLCAEVPSNLCAEVPSNLCAEVDAFHRVKGLDTSNTVST